LERGQGSIVEHFPSIHEAVGSIPSTRKKRKKERRKEGALVVFSFLNKVWCVDQ
jgi:hypothetical protein